MTEQLPTNQDVAAVLAQLVEVARAEFGETQWRYSKKQVTWSRFRRRPGHHTVPIGDGEEVTKDEYDANIEESKRRDLEAFMGRYPYSYTRYDKTIGTPGWRERLMEIIKTVES